MVRGGRVGAGGAGITQALACAAGDASRSAEGRTCRRPVGPPANSGPSGGARIHAPAQICLINLRRTSLRRAVGIAADDRQHLVRHPVGVADRIAEVLEILAALGLLDAVTQLDLLMRGKILDPPAALAGSLVPLVRRRAPDQAAARLSTRSSPYAHANG